MKISHLLASAALGCAIIAAPALADPLPMDTPVTVDGLTTVCTGIGDEAQNDPRWKAYPVRIEFSNAISQYLSGAHVTLESAAGKMLAAIDCSGAWVLFQLAPGNYKVTATLLHHPKEPARSAAISPPASGQKRFVLQFKGVTGSD